MSDTLIKVENVSKKFCRSLKTSLKYGIQDIASELLGHRHGGNGELRPGEFWALNDISFELKRGECLGLIGHNGAGKTTLLRMLNGLIKPDAGRIEMRGRIGALIALGAGFSPVLTGRENIYVNASILGIRKEEVDRKMNDILEFAEIGEFIDAPVQTYSSGMNVRLGFAIAAILIEPDILFLDEVLAVGDGAFKYKCYNRLDNILRKSAVIFVSHDIPQLARVCNRSILLNDGKILLNGTIEQGIEAYETLNAASYTDSAPTIFTHPPITKLEIIDIPADVSQRTPLAFKAIMQSTESIPSINIRVDIKNQSGAFCAACLVHSNKYNIKINSGYNNWVIQLSELPLKPGRYSISIVFTNPRGAIVAVWNVNHKLTINGLNTGIPSDCQLAIDKWHPY